MPSDEIGLHVLANAAIYDFAQNYLDKRGWFASLQGEPQDHEGLIPWITYPALRQLRRIVRPDWRIFEYGCGSSSLWWAKHVQQVVSVEHDSVWSAKISGQAPANLKVIARPMGEPCPPHRQKWVEDFMSRAPELPLSEDAGYNVVHGLNVPDFAAYATEITAYPQDHFDVVVIDGMARALCASIAGSFVKRDGIIVFDNADRWQYNAGYRALAQMGFKRIDYYGPGPASRSEWCTSLFARSLDAFAASVDSPHGDSELGW
jgi:hypothetical protein